MKGFFHVLTTVFVGLCSFIAIILLFKNQPFPLKIWGWNQSSIVKWVLLVLSAFMIPPLLSLLWFALFDWLIGNDIRPGLATRVWKRITVKNNCDILRDLLRSLKFFLNAVAISCTGLFILLILSDVVPEIWDGATVCMIFCFGISTWTSMHFFFKSRWYLLDLKRDFSFINSEEAFVIIAGNYARANKFLKSVLKKIFPIQLYDL